MKEARILVVDDDSTNVAVLDGMLGDAGYTQVRSTTDSRRVLPLCREFRPDLILLDLRMPHLDGLAVLESIAEAFRGGEFPPVMVLTADCTPATRKIALAAGASDFMTKPIEHTEALLRIAGLLNIYKGRVLATGETPDWIAPPQLMEEREFRLMFTYAAIVVFVVLAACFGMWYVTLNKRVRAASADLLPAKAQWMNVSKRVEQAQAARSRILTEQNAIERLLGKRRSASLAAAFRIVVHATGRDIDLHDFQGGVDSDSPDQATCQLRIDGVSKGQAPRESADRFRKTIRTNLEEHAGRDLVSARFERLEDDSPSASADPALQSAHFTILATIGSHATAAEIK